ncbi:MAG: TetR/AcrR family transcriptional regulator [Acidimicrobiia bacterium]|nr:TetR/AcrR family transcriptional regulator [Acidimicrobiia bacterium]
MTSISPPAVESDLSERILESLSDCIARHGVTKTTLDDVAAEAGCSRATLYRYFPGKRTMVEALVQRRWARLNADLATACRHSESLDDALVAILVHASRTLRADGALVRVLELEPEMVLPYVAFDGADTTFAVVAESLVEPLERFTGAEGARRTGEWAARLVLSYTLSYTADSGGAEALADPAFARTLVRDFVVPGCPRAGGGSRE